MKYLKEQLKEGRVKFAGSTYESINYNTFLDITSKSLYQEFDLRIYMSKNDDTEFLFISDNNKKRSISDSGIYAFKGNSVKLEINTKMIKEIYGYLNSNNEIDGSEFIVSLKNDMQVFLTF